MYEWACLIHNLHVLFVELEVVIDHMKVDSTAQHKEQEGLEQLLVKTNQEKMALQYDKRQILKEIAIKVISGY